MNTVGSGTSAVFVAMLVVLSVGSAGVAAANQPGEGTTAIDQSSLGSETHGDASGAVSDADSSTAASTGLQGSLTVTATNADGDPVEGAKVILYDDDYEPVEGKFTNSDGSVSWSGLNTGRYVLELYGPNGDFWGAKTVTVDSASTRTTIRRTAPRLVAVALADRTDSDGTFYVGDTINIGPEVRNDGPERAVRVKIMVDVDDDGTPEITKTRGGRSTAIASGDVGYYGYDFTPSSAGVKRVRVVTETYIAGDWVTTDRSGWTKAFTVRSEAPRFQDRAVYVWGYASTLARDEAAANRFFERTDELGINTVFLSWGALKSVPAEERAVFVKSAHSNGLQVHALTGPRGSKAVLIAEQTIAEVLAYNDDRPEVEQFDGIHLNPEPGDVGLDTFLDDYHSMLDGARMDIRSDGATVNSQGLALSSAVGWWWSNQAPTRTRNLLEHDALDYVVVMAYYETESEVRNRVSNAVSNVDTPYVVAIETQEFPKSGPSERVTFYEEGYEAANSALTSIASNPPVPGHLGGALHQYQSSISTWDAIADVSVSADEVHRGETVTVAVKTVFDDNFPQSAHRSRVVVRFNGPRETYEARRTISPPGSQLVRTTVDWSPPEDATTGRYRVTVGLLDTTIENDGRNAVASRSDPVLLDTASGGEIEVTAGAREPPSAQFTYSPSNPSVDEAVSFDASESVGREADVQRYEWDFDGDGTTDATGETVTHTYSEPGEYTVTLTVTDGSGATDTVTKSVSVSKATETPATAAVSITNVTTNAPVEVGGSLEVTVQVENTGTEAAAQEVVLDVGDRTAVATAPVALQAGETATVTLTHETASGDVGTVDGTVRSANDSATITARVTGPDDSPTDGDASFDPEVTAFFCHEVLVAVDDSTDRFSRVTLFMHDGTEVTFTGDYPSGESNGMVFGLEGRRSVTWMVYDGGGPHEVVTYDEFHGPIERVAVSNGEATRTFENDVEGCVESVAFGDDGTAVTISTVGRGEKALLLYLANGSYLSVPPPGHSDRTVTISGSRTFRAGGEEIESVRIGNDGIVKFELLVGRESGTDDSEGDGEDGGDGGDSATDGSQDSDGDGLTDARERELGTDPQQKDTDGDLYWDGDEVRSGTDPTDAEDYPIRDSDGDKYTDRDEVAHGTDPNDPNDYPARQDSDGDKLTDDRERAIGTDPNERDTDGDRYWDGDEWRSGTDPTDPDDAPRRDSGEGSDEDREDSDEDRGESQDSDGDGLTDARERELGTDPAKTDTDGDLYWDGDEIRSGTDPTDADDYPIRDSDGDKYTDRDEVAHGTDPNDPNDFPARQDSDGDKLTDDRERAIGTDPNERDTDGDRYWDGDEWRSGTDPTDPDDHP